MLYRPYTQSRKTTNDNEITDGFTKLLITYFHSFLTILLSNKNFVIKMNVKIP